MEKTIWKYIIEIKDSQEINMPLGAEILSIQNQNESICIWVLVSPKEARKEIRIFEIFGTGHPINYDMGVNRIFIQTFQYSEGQFVGHVFERLD